MITKEEGGVRFRADAKKSPPLVSIITVVFRAQQQLAVVIDSVLRLKDDQTEFIVIDGGSEDGTRELLRQYNSQIDYWVSEQDNGIYEAMNKGVAAARGTFIFHLNAGDRLLCIPIQQLESAAHRRIDAAAFRVLIDGNKVFRPTYDFMLRLTNTLHHQGTFFRREGLPSYDTRYHVFADFDVNQRLALRRARIQTFEQVVALHISGGVSDVASAPAISEFFHIIAKNYGSSYVPIAWLCCKWRGFISRIERFR